MKILLDIKCVDRQRFINFFYVVEEWPIPDLAPNSLSPSEDILETMTDSYSTVINMRHVLTW